MYECGQMSIERERRITEEQQLAECGQDRRAKPARAAPVLPGNTLGDHGIRKGQ